MELHHSRHHQAYVTGLNTAMASYSAALASNDIAAQIALQAAIRFHGGGHINHSLFWEGLAPSSSPDTDCSAAAPELAARIAGTWGDLDAFKAAMTKQLMGLQGSGWGWLVRDAAGGGGGGGGGLRMVITKDQDPIVGGEVPIFGIDMWEHAYYLQVSTFSSPFSIQTDPHLHLHIHASVHVHAIVTFLSTLRLPAQIRLEKKPQALLELTNRAYSISTARLPTLTTSGKSSIGEPQRIAF